MHIDFHHFERMQYYIYGLELMKLIFAVLDVSLTMDLTRCHKTEGFFTFINIRPYIILHWCKEQFSKYRRM